ncbi:hypothetical protein VTN00DRAFT_8825 [Thermoascus crustaceus]|uniref:uncharacterized protein n=1 Tax=Thermoascus crustaceus TaxID=5088 RepID=UPI0037422561
MENTITGTAFLDAMDHWSGIEIDEWSGSPIPAELNLITKTKDGRPVNPYGNGRVVTAWMAHAGPVEPERQFCAAGDEGGAFIVDSNRTGSITGLLDGTDGATKSGYFVPFHLVVQDIVRVTRGKVVNPIMI